VPGARRVDLQNGVPAEELSWAARDSQRGGASVSMREEAA
jgi:hypothetical protein